MRTVPAPGQEGVRDLELSFVERPDVELEYGLRYDFYNYPEGDPSAPFGYSQNFADDGNNFGPRFGLAYSFGADKRQVLRASSGIMYDQMLLGAYETAIQNSGNPSRINVTLAGTAANAPAFPTSLADLPPGFVLPRQSITTVDPDFQVARTWQNNVQYERAFGADYHGSVGYTYPHGQTTAPGRLGVPATLTITFRRKAIP